MPHFVAKVGNVLEDGRQQFMIESGSGRVLVNTIVEETAEPITVVQNWTPGE